MIIYRQRLSTLFLLYLSLLWLPTHVHATQQRHQATQEERQVHSFLFDRYMSPYASSPCLMSGRILLSEAEDYLFPPRTPTSLGRCYLSSVWNNIVNDLLMLTSHEVNGHGFRRRSFDRPVSGYGLFLLFGGIPVFLSPVNGLGGYTSYGSTEKATSTDEALLEVIAGNEANSVLANELVLQRFSRGALDYRDYNLFFKAFTNLLGYIVITRDSGTGGTATSMQGDIEVYLEKINKKHSTEGIYLNDLQWASLTFFLNPILYMSIWSFYAHIFQGQRTCSIPQLKWGDTNYMPIIRMGLTPFGLMYYLDNYIGYNNKTFLVSLEGGKSPFYSNGYGGVHIKTHQLWNYKNYGLDVEGHLWCQPSLQFETHKPVEDKNHWGGLVGLSNQLQLTEMFSLNAAVLYKTQGFAEGVVAEEGLMFRGGCTLCY
ncbi:MAG: hypothetical protein ROO73_05820 [Roseivirga sp.]